VLVQATLATPLFETRWRWNVCASLLVPRWKDGRKVPPPLVRMRAQDHLALAFPEILACPENLPGGNLPVPDEHPLVRQTLDDCLEQAMDVDGFLQVLRDAVLNARPYSFLDDAPLEERRTQAVQQRRILDVKTADELGALDPAAVERVRDEAWPDPRSADEVHEALLWMGYLTRSEAEQWRPWVDELLAAGRVEERNGRVLATEVLADPGRSSEKALLRGRMEALGPVFEHEPLLEELEREGHLLRVRLDGRTAWCDRRLLARIHRYTVERLRQEIAPVSVAVYLRFMAAWQHVAVGHRLEGPNGVATALRQLAGFEAHASTWEARLLPMRIEGYRKEWLDQLTISGELAWGRLWGSGDCALRAAPIAFFPREDWDLWCSLAEPVEVSGLSAPARKLHRVLVDRGAMFPQELTRATELLGAEVEVGVAELFAHGAITCDSFAALRQLLLPPSRRRRRVVSVGRFSLLRHEDGGDAPGDAAIERVARVLLQRYGIVCRAVLQRERIPVPWRDLVRAYRRLELRGEIRGGRFVAGPGGEHFGIPEAIPLLRRLRKEEAPAPLETAAADPLNLRGVITAEERVPATSRRTITLG
jgi:ATP-dependent Lhr-like helicase